VVLISMALNAKRRECGFANTLHPGRGCKKVTGKPANGLRMAQQWEDEWSQGRAVLACDRRRYDSIFEATQA